LNEDLDPEAILAALAQAPDSVSELVGRLMALTGEDPVTVASRLIRADLDDEVAGRGEWYAEIDV
jgi:hypothetical protein